MRPPDTWQGSGMSIFRRGARPAASIPELLLQGQEMIERTAAAHRDQWGLGSAERWDVDLDAGTRTFSTKTASAPVQVLGAHVAAREEFVWAWSMDAVPAPLKRDAEAVRDFGAANGATMLTTPRLPVDESGASDLATLAFRISRASGFYRGPGASTTFFTFGLVTVTHADGSAQSFDIQIAE
jgi:hypothetical protein